MRHLILCGSCHRQLDAGDRPAGERVRCACGEWVEVPALLPHDSAVVRCSACGAPREGDEPECRYCGSSFTVYELDIDTICPFCMARVSGGARFCSHCGSPILVGQAAAGATPMPCPACGPQRHLKSRRLGAEPVAVAECEVCAGLWVDTGTFQVLAARARLGQLDGAVAAPAAAAAGAAAVVRRTLAPGAAGPAGARPAAAAPGVAGPGVVAPRGGTPGAPAAWTAGAGGHLYRPCAVCGALMNRQNYGRKSGVILDVCRAHGIWFDAGELPRVLGWIRDGGERRAGELAAEQDQAQARQRRLEQEAGRSLTGGWGHPEVDTDLFRGLGDLIGEGLGSLFHRG
jgi:Zn-finger nucleic acid-binding protein